MTQTLYFGSPDRRAVEGKKIYCGVDNTSKLVKKIYVGQSGRSVQIYPSVSNRWYAPGWYRFNWKSLMNISNFSLQFGSRDSEGTSTTVIFPFLPDFETTEGFKSKILSPGSNSIIDVLSNNCVVGEDTPLFGDFNYISSPDANYFYVTHPFTIKGESEGYSSIYNPRSDYLPEIQRAIPFGNYALKLSNLLYAYADLDVEFQYELNYFHGFHKKVWFTYYSSSYPGYVGCYINLDITGLQEIQLDDYLPLVQENEYLQSRYALGEHFALFPQGNLILGLYSVEEGSWKLESFTFDQLMRKGKSERNVAGEIWVPFSQPLISEFYSNYVLNRTDSKTFLDVENKNSLGYWISDPLCHVLTTWNSTFGASKISAVTVSNSASPSSWNTLHKDYWSRTYKKFGFSVAPMYYQSLYDMDPMNPVTAETTGLTNIRDNIIASSVYPTGSSSIYTSDDSNAYIFVWGTKAPIGSTIIPEIIENTQIFGTVLQDMPDNTFSYYNFENVQDKLNVPLNMSFNANVRCMPIFYDGQITYIPGWLGNGKNTTINYY